MTQLTYSKTQTTATLSAGIETNLLENGASGLTFAPFFQPGAGACLVPGGGDIVDILLTNNDVTNSINTVTIYLLADKGGTFSALSFTTSVSTTASRHIQMRGFTGAAIRVTGNSTSGTTASTTADVTVTASDPSAPRVWQLIVDGVVQGQALGGTITGNLAQSGGTVVLNATGAFTADASTSSTIGGTTGTVVLGRTAQVASIPGGATIGISKAVTGLGAMAVEAAAASTLTLGAASNAVALGQAGKAVTVAGNLAMTAPATVNLGDATVSQGTNNHTGVTINAASGVITPFGSYSLSAATADTGYTVTNSAVAAGSIVHVEVTDYSGTYITNGVPFVVVTAVGSGSFNILVMNFHATNALSGTLKIRFAVL